jgi:hypothetical protein
MGGYYSYLAMEVVVGYRDCVEAGAAEDGRKLVFPLWTVTRIDGPNRYAVSKVQRDVPVEGPTDALFLGETVSVAGVFRAADAVVVQEIREEHLLRKYKEGLGIFGVLAATVAAPFAFRVRGRRLVARG